MQQTPLEFKKLADSVELYDQSEAIGAKFGLHIDQVGELDAEIRDVLNGVSASSDFSKHIIERLEIDRKLADQIVAEVNTAVFGALREQMQSSSISNEEKTTISSLERAGNFNIEPTMGQNGNGVGDGKQDGNWKDVTHADRDAILAGVEDPKNDGADTQNGDAEPLVDYLLQNPIGQREHKVLDHVPDNLPVVETTPIPKYDQSPDNMAMPTPTQKPTSVTPPSTVPNKPTTTPTKPGFDPYKEPIA
jgi:hypothetical protein